MGCFFSCISSKKPKKFDTVRVVHLNGYVEDFDHPVTVCHVAEKPEKYFVCTAVQLLSVGSHTIMAPETVLEPGRIYFLLPYSALQADMSPLDLAALARKLTALAKTGKSDPSQFDQFSPRSPFSSRRGGSSPVWEIPGRVEEEDHGASLSSFGPRRSSTRVRSWKPNLDPIKERSFHRRNESDLQLQDSLLEDFPS